MDGPAGLDGQTGWTGGEVERTNVLCVCLFSVFVFGVFCIMCAFLCCMIVLVMRLNHKQSGEHVEHMCD